MTVHRFQPDHYYNTLGTHPPVLHISDGDTVITTTVDAHGWDEHERQVAEGSNPQTGPFYVEGAAPGDTLVLHLDQLRPNRAGGWSGTAVWRSPSAAARDQTGSRTTGGGQ